MTEKFSVKKAAKIGQFVINVPAVMLFIGPPILYFVFASKIDWIWALSIVIMGFLVSWLYWSVAVTKWRVWAFSNVRNVHELKKKAIEQGLIWKDGSIFAKTEIQSADDKLKLAELALKFNLKDQFEEDPSIPASTIVFNSKGKTMLAVFISLFIFSVGVYLIVNGEHRILGGITVVFALIGSYSTFTDFRNAAEYVPQIELDELGIKTINTSFKKWSEVYNEEVIAEGTGNRRKYYMVYQFEDGSEELNISRKELENLLRTYRIRSEKIKEKSN